MQELLNSFIQVTTSSGVANKNINVINVQGLDALQDG